MPQRFSFGCSSFDVSSFSKRWPICRFYQSCIIIGSILTLLGFPFFEILSIGLSSSLIFSISTCDFPFELIDYWIALKSMKPEIFLSIVFLKSLMDFLCSGEFKNSFPLMRIKLVVFINRLLLTESMMRFAPGETLVFTLKLPGVKGISFLHWQEDLLELALLKLSSSLTP